MEISKELLRKLSEADKVAALTGAGISAESGIKTFRDPDGLWAKFDPSELSSADGFMRNPKLVWTWYQERREIIYSKKPNSGHYALAEMEKIFDDFALTTQNVDRLHQQAGSSRVYELHGNIIENHCMDCKRPYEKEIDMEAEEPPRCEHCGGRIRPSVVWFGEMLPMDALRKSQEAAASADLYFSVGTAAEVFPAAELPIIALRNGAYVVEVNPNDTAFSAYANERLQAPAGEALPKLVDEYKKFIE